MKTKRAYYTCPIITAYMAKYHNMRFQQVSEYGQIVDVALCTILDQVFETDPRENYIHPDDMRLLESQDGDIALNSDNEPIQVIKDGKPRGKYQEWKSKVDEFLGKEASIIYRDGMPFPWPKFEEAAA